MGIIICGLNGSGKSTLGRALAETLGWRFIDNEDLYFPKADPEEPFAVVRTQEEVTALLLAEVQRDDRFVFASVRGNHGAAVLPYYKAAVLVEVPRDVRLARIRQRSLARFGERALPGGDLYESEMRFYEMAAARPESYASAWLTGLSIPILRVDGTQPTAENVTRISAWLAAHHPL